MIDINERPILTYRLVKKRGHLILEQSQLGSGICVDVPINKIKDFSNSGMDEIWGIAEQNEFYEIMAIIRDERERRTTLNIIDRYSPPFK